MGYEVSFYLGVYRGFSGQSNFMDLTCLL